MKSMDLVRLLQREVLPDDDLWLDSDYHDEIVVTSLNGKIRGWINLANSEFRKSAGPRTRT